MAAGVITINRKKYAVGLFWQPLPVGKKIYNFAKQLSKQIPGKVKFYTDFRSMVGIGSRALGHHRGMKVAAAEAMNYFSEYNSFLAEFFTPQGFWIIAVRNNIIIFDQLFSAESNAKQEFAKLMKLPDWDIVIATGSWDIPHASEKTLGDIITGKSESYLSPISGAMGHVVALLIFFASIFGMWYLFHGPIVKMFAPRPQQIQINQEVLKEYKKQLEMKKAEIQATMQSAVGVPPYNNLPDPSLRANQCWRSIAFVMQPVSGWEQQSAICEGNTAKASLKRTHGTLEGLYSSVDSLMGKNVYVLENTESDVIISVELTSLGPSDNNVAKTDIEDIIFSVNNIFQKIGEFANIKPSAETSGQGDTAITTNLVTINTDSKLKPEEFVKMFNGLSPMSIESVKWDARSRTWNYEVKIYAK